MKSNKFLRDRISLNGWSRLYLLYIETASDKKSLDKRINSFYDKLSKNFFSKDSENLYMSIEFMMKKYIYGQNDINSAAEVLNRFTNLYIDNGNYADANRILADVAKKFPGEFSDLLEVLEARIDRKSADVLAAKSNIVSDEKTKRELTEKSKEKRKGAKDRIIRIANKNVDFKEIVVKPEMEELMEMGQDESAEKFALIYLNHPNSLSAKTKQELCKLLGELYISHRKYDKAISTMGKTVEEVLALGDADFDIDLLIQLNVAYGLKGEKDRATEYLQQIFDSYSIDNPILQNKYQQILKELESKTKERIFLMKDWGRFLPEGEGQEIEISNGNHRDTGEYGDALSGERRCEYLLQQNGEQPIIIKETGFSGYIAFPFEEKNLVVLEPFFDSITSEKDAVKYRRMNRILANTKDIYTLFSRFRSIGIKDSIENATYVLPFENWQEIATKSKSEIRDYADTHKELNIHTIQHRGTTSKESDVVYWYRRLNEEFDVEARSYQTKANEARRKAGIAKVEDVTTDDIGEIPIQNVEMSNIEALIPDTIFELLERIKTINSQINCLERQIKMFEGQLFDVKKEHDEAEEKWSEDEDEFELVKNESARRKKSMQGEITDKESNSDTVIDEALKGLDDEEINYQEYSDEALADCIVYAQRKTSIRVAKVEELESKMNSIKKKLAELRERKKKKEEERSNLESEISVDENAS